MADTNENNGAAAAAPAETPKVTQRVIAQYVRDMSFENVLAQKGLQGDLQPEV